MSVVGGHGSNYGCSAHHNKGDAICTNRRLISERKVNAMVLAGIVDYVQGPSFQTWLEEATAKAERARMKSAPNEELHRLNTQVQAQQAKVERMAQTLFEVVVPSETLRTMFAREDARLLELKRKQAETSLPIEVREAFNLRQAARALEEIQGLVDADPRAARERLSKYVDSVVCTPTEENGVSEYTAEIVMKNETAALAGGRVADDYSCGDRI